MEKLQINGHEVVFTEREKHCWTGSSYYGGAVHHCDIRQWWRIPTLELKGYVKVIETGRSKTLNEIQETIQQEVDFDLEQRKKKELGLPTNRYSDFWR